ncbi:hypothetical protein B0H11DRAFT_1153310, partial [Mycena galericulata]
RTDGASESRGGRGSRQIVRSVDSTRVPAPSYTASASTAPPFLSPSCAPPPPPSPTPSPSPSSSSNATESCSDRNLGVYPRSMSPLRRYGDSDGARVRRRNDASRRERITFSFAFFQSHPWSLGDGVTTGCHPAPTAALPGPSTSSSSWESASAASTFSSSSSSSGYRAPELDATENRAKPVQFVCCIVSIIEGHEE